MRHHERLLPFALACLLLPLGAQLSSCTKITTDSRAPDTASATATPSAARTGSSEVTTTPHAFEVGLNKIDLVTGYLGTASGGNRTEAARATTVPMARKALQDAKNMGVTFFRVNLDGWGSTDLSLNELALWQSDPTTYWSWIDEMMADVEAAGLKIVPGFVWSPQQYCFLSGGMGSKETILDLYTNPNSQSYQLLAKYITEFVTRYRNRNAILFYELGNEFNLSADFDYVGWLNQGNGSSAYIANYTTDNLNTFFQNVSGLLHSLDPTRGVDSGNACPQSNSYSQWKHLKGPDTLAQSQLYIQQANAGMDIVSVHMYESSSQNDYTRFGSNALASLQFLKSAAASVGKKLYLGEFGDSIATDSDAQRATFFSGVYSAIEQAQIPYSSPWIFEFYQFTTDQDQGVFVIDPSYSDSLDTIIQSAATAGGSYAAPPAATPPNVVVTVPVDGAAMAGQQELFAVASANQGSLQKVEFFIDGNAVGTATAPPYTVTVDLSGIANGNHVITAQATDSGGLTSSYSSNATGGQGSGSGLSVSFTSNGLDNLEVYPDSNVTYAWTVTGAASLKSQVTVSGGVDGCGGKSGAWAISNQTTGFTGSITAGVQTCQAGTTYTLTLIATAADGSVSQASNTLTVLPLAQVELETAGFSCGSSCVWAEGWGFAAAGEVVTRDLSWNPLGTYSGAQLSVQSDGTGLDTLSFALSSKKEKALAATAGLIITVSNGPKWDSVTVAAP